MTTLVWVIECLIWTAVVLCMGAWALVMANLRIVAGVLNMAAEVWVEGPRKD